MRRSFVNSRGSGSSTTCWQGRAAARRVQQRSDEPPCFVRVLLTGIMSTKLDKTIRREIEIDGEPFTISISPEGFRLTKKRFRSGVALSWKTLWTRRRWGAADRAGIIRPNVNAARCDCGTIPGQSYRSNNVTLDTRMQRSRKTRARRRAADSGRRRRLSPPGAASSAKVRCCSNRSCRS